MPTSRRPVVRLREILLFLAVTLAAACTHWTTVEQPVDQVVREKEPDRMLVTRSDNSVIELETPSITGDSLVGFSGSIEPPVRVAIPLEDIKKIQIRGTDVVATSVIAIGIGFTIIAAIAAGSEDPPENQHAANSCPLVYSWDGESWRLDSGTFGSAFLQPLSRTDLDNLDFVRETNGTLKLKLANELQETDYVDALSILAVDHEPGVSVSPDGLGIPRTLGTLTLPVSANDYRGHDALARVLRQDGWNWESSPSGRDSAVTEDLRDGLELVFARERGSRLARLVVDGNSTPWAAHLIREYLDLHGRATQAWYDSLDAQPEEAVRLGETLAREGFLSAAVWTDSGWERQGVIWEAGPEVVKRQVFNLDLSRVRGDSVRIRLESAPSFWLIDHVAIDYSPERPFTVREVFAETATDGSGRDVSSYLSAIDGNHLVLETGEYAELSFRVPDLPPNHERTYLLRTTGWYRIHSDTSGEPEVVLLDRIAHEPGAIARLSVARMNKTMRALAERQP